MNIFVTARNPYLSAIRLPDKHAVKMPIECCQMLALVYSDHYFSWGTLPKVDGTPYSTARGAHKNHPCTVWTSQSIDNVAWLITHGLSLCQEYFDRYGKTHGCLRSLERAKFIYEEKTSCKLYRHLHVNTFVRAMPASLADNQEIDTFTAYRLYLRSKPWVASNYLRNPARKPEWLK